MKPFGLGAARPAEAALIVEGLGRLSRPRRAGAYLIHAVDGEDLEAVQFAPPGLDIGSGEGARAVLDEAVEAFLELGERLKVLELAVGPRVCAVVRAPEGAFWVQDATGLTLEAWLAAHPAPSEATVHAFARRLAAALESLHAHGLVHGDVSPAAIVIEDGEVRLALPAVDRRGLFRVLRSQAGLVQPGYAPPEAHDGARRQAIGPAADLYGASAVLRRLLTGSAPDPANAMVRLAGETSDAALAGSSLRGGIEAGLAMAPAHRPASAAAWLSGLALPPEPDSVEWFEGVAAAPPPAPEAPLSLRPEPAPEAPPEVDFVIAPPPADAFAPLGDEARLGPLGETRAERRPPARGGGLSTVLIAAAIATAAVAGGIAVWLKPDPKPAARAAAAPAVAPLPMAPVGCQWSPSGGVGLRLVCADEPGPVALPDRFDTQTATLASRGEVAAMERLGAFYRARAARLTTPNRVTYGDEAYAWLARAADSNPTGRSEDERARDDAALALGEMFGSGEGGRAVDPAAAETRLRQAAAGSRADAVLALAQRLWAEAQQDPEAGSARLTEARRLFSRVARLTEDSPLRATARQALEEIDARREAAEAAARAARDAAARKAERQAEADRAAEVARKANAAKAARAAPKPAKATKPVIPPRAMAKARAVIGEAKSKLVAAKDAAVKAAAAAKPAPPKPAPKPPAKRLETPRPPPPPPVRSWTARTSVRVDPTADFTFEVQEAGHAACEAEGGYAASVRGGEVICPNGVNYCQVRVAAFCRGQ